MCKPLHAGRAAQAGLRAALLATRGFTSNPEVLETPHVLRKDTSDEALDSDATAARLGAGRSDFGGRPRLELRLRDGRMLQASKDVGIPEADLDQQGISVEASSGAS